jgi:hypothetical protein
MQGTSKKAVFVSYASQDAEAAGQICAALRTSGVEVWFDQSELRGGDAWDAKIRRQIKECALFIPIISTHTQERPEGYFRLEWHLAEQRTFLMASDQPFLVPVTVDETREEDARVPDRFRERQWMRLVGGATSTDFVERITKLMGSNQEASTGLPSPTKWAPEHPARKPHFLLVASIALGATLAGVLLWLHRTGPATSADPVISQVNALLARADAAVGSGKNAPSKEALDTSGVFIEQAKALDPNNGEIWAEEALNDLGYIANAVDASQERKTRAAAEADRAMILAPQSFKTRVAHAFELVEIVRSRNALPEAEKELRALLVESPNDTEVMMALGKVLRLEGRSREAADFLMRANIPEQAAWEFQHAGDWTGMDAAASALLKLDPLAVEPKIQVELHGFEDTSAVRRILEGIPSQELLKDYPASYALLYWYMLREPQKMLDIASAFPREWISTWYYLEPKAAWEGYAYRLQGNMDAAKVEWNVALKEIDDRLAATSDDAHLLLLQSDMNSELGLNEQAAASLRLYKQFKLNAQSFYSMDHLRWLAVMVRLGRNDEVFNSVESLLRHPKGEDYSIHGEIRFYPDLNPLHADLRFHNLMLETKPSVAKSME